MTKHEFKKILVNKDRYNYIGNYILCSVLFLCGLFFIYLIFDYKLLPSNKGIDYLTLILPSFLCSLSIYGFWRIRKDYDIIELYQKDDVASKYELFQSYLSLKEVVSNDKMDSLLIARYKNKYLNKVDLYFYADNDKLLTNIRGVSQYGGLGFVDFGLTKRAKNNFIKFLNNAYNIN